MKEYKLELPERLNSKAEEISEYLLVQHYEDGILSAGACAFLLGISKHDFQTKILYKFGLSHLS